jgi:hypothetical protein
MEIKQYTAKIKHDKGIFTLKTFASCIESAKIMICKAENCPENAILSIKKV